EELAALVVAGRVDEGDAAVEGRLDGLVGLVGVRGVHGTEAELSDHEAGAAEAAAGDRGHGCAFLRPAIHDRWWYDSVSRAARWEFGPPPPPSPAPRGRGSELARVLHRSLADEGDEC